MAGTYTGEQAVTISCATDGAVIHYTTNGSEPTAESQTYSDPISISESTTVRAIAVMDGMTDSPVSEAAYTIVAAPVAYTVTYKVVGGTWSDDSTEDKTETVQSGSKPANVPVGMKASEGFTGGAWDADPTDATITEATTFTYIFDVVKTPAAVKEAPTAKSLTYTGSAQKLVNAGIAEGGTMLYVLGTDAVTAPTAGYTTSIPGAMCAGTYYVWYMVKGDGNHNDSAAACCTVTVTDPVTEILLDRTRYDFGKGESVPLTARILPLTAKQAICWQTSNPAVAIVCDVNGDELPVAQAKAQEPIRLQSRRRF